MWLTVTSPILIKYIWDSVTSYYYHYSFESFPHQRLLMVFNWSLNDSKSPQVSRTLLSILANLNYAVVKMVSICAFISKSSSFFGIVLIASITIDITVTFMSRSSFGFSYKIKVRISHFGFFNFTLWYAGMTTSAIRRDLFFNFFFLLWLPLRLVVWAILGDLFVSQNPREVSATHSPRWILGCAYIICSHGQI